jgi:class 3 adenylate cyclase
MSSPPTARLEEIVQPRSLFGKLRDGAQDWRLPICLALGASAALAGYGLLVPEAFAWPKLRAIIVLAACLVAAGIAWKGSDSPTTRSLVGFLAAVTLTWALIWFLVAPTTVRLWLLGVAALATGALFVRFTSVFPRTLTEADVVHGPPHTVLPARLVSALHLSTETRKTLLPTKPAPHPADIASLTAAVASVVILFLVEFVVIIVEELQELKPGTWSFGPILRAYVGDATHALSCATLILLVGVALEPLVRSAFRERRSTARLPHAVRLLAVLPALGSAAALAFLGTVHARESLTLATGAVVLAHLGRLGSKERLLDWFLTFVVASVFARGIDAESDWWILNGFIVIAVFAAPWRLLHQYRILSEARRRARRGRHAEDGVDPDVLFLRPWYLRQLVIKGAVFPIFLYVAVEAARSAVPELEDPGRKIQEFGLLAIPGLAAITLMLRGTLHVMLGYATSDTEVRRKALWLVTGLTSAAGMLFLGISSGGTGVKLAFLAVFPLTVLSIAVAVYYQGALDPRLALRKTSLFALLGVGGVVLYAGVENLIQDRVASWLGIPEAASPWLAGGIVVLTIGSLQGRLAGWITAMLERLFPELTLTDEGTEVSAVVAALDIADDDAADPAAVRAAARRAKLLQIGARSGVRRHGGRVAVASRDVILLEFPDAVAALAGIAAIEAEYERLCARARVPVIGLRKGVHAGMVWRQPDGAVFGSTVEVADELRRSAPPGGVVVSPTVFDALGSVGDPAFVAISSNSDGRESIHGYQLVMP